jgi:ABC-type branched-subunit amino acid transport system ATPase component
MLNKIYFLIPKKLKNFFFLIILFILFGSLLEMIGIGLVFPIIAVLNSEELFYSNLIKLGIDRDYIKNFIFNTNLTLAQFLILVFFCVFLLRTFFLVCVARFQINFILKLYNELSTTIFKNYLLKDYNFFFTNNSAFLIRNISGETSIFSNYIVNGIITLISEGLLLFVIVALLLAVNFKITTIIIILLSIFSYLVYFFLTKKILIATRSRQELEGQKQKTMQSLNNIKEIKISQLELFFYKKFEDFNNKLKDINTTYLFLQQMPKYLIEFLSILILGLVIFFTSNSINSNIVPLLALYAASAFRILPSFNRIIQNFNQISFGKSSINVLFDTFASEYQKYDFEKQVYKKLNFEHLEIKNLTFSYNERKKIFEKINLEINKGDFIGIVGPSGSGKSTFVNLICGLIEPDEGKIIINKNFNLKDIRYNFLRLIGYMPQNVNLFDDTIKNNICLDKFEINKDLNQKFYQMSLANSQLNTFVESLPKKDDTIVGENGINLSGGQKQRVGIARALIANPDLLIFDEPTSNLDKITTSKVIEIIKNLNKKKTVILITHDKKIVKYCNKIINIDQNGIIKINDK